MTILLHEKQKINLKWIKNLNIGPEAIKLLEENICSEFLDISLGKDFLDLTPKSKDNKSKKKKELQLVSYNKGNHQQNEKATYETGQIICKLHIL